MISGLSSYLNDDEMHQVERRISIQQDSKLGDGQYPVMSTGPEAKSRRPNECGSRMVAAVASSIDHRRRLDHQSGQNDERHRERPHESAMDSAWKTTAILLPLTTALAYLVNREVPDPYLVSPVQTRRRACSSRLVYRMRSFISHKHNSTVVANF